MHLINESEVAVESRKSPGGVFEILRRHVSLALGGVKDVGAWGGGHPFDIELAIIPPGKKGYPYHAHAAQTEYYIIVSGSGQVVDGKGSVVPLRAGDHFIVLPGEAHQVFNDSNIELRYFVIADHHRADVTTYPKTGKRQIKPEMRCVQVEDVDYYLGEE